MKKPLRDLRVQGRRWPPDDGIPVILFMDNYGMNCKGYHDSHDTTANIDLDYGTGVVAMAIKAVARAATEKPPRI